MLQVAIQVLLYAILAGLSPLAFAATIAVMHSGRPNALAFAVGVVAAQLLVCAVFLAVDFAATGSGRRHFPGIQVALEIAVAVGLIWLAGWVRRRGPIRNEGPSERTARLSERLGRVHLLTALGAGLLLGLVSPKRLLLAALAATTISTGGLRDSVQAVIMVVYVAVATAIVWVPVILFVLFGERAVALMKRSQGEVVRRQPEVTVYALLLLAALFTINAVGVLLTQIT